MVTPRLLFTELLLPAGFLLFGLQQLLLFLPLYEFPLAFFAFIKGQNVRHEAAGDRFNLYCGMFVLLMSFFLLPK